VVAFRAVAELHSFRKAAEELHLTQPAVSLQIKALEEDIGVQLFDRTGAHIALTESGKVLLGYSRQASALFVQPEPERPDPARRVRSPWLSNIRCDG
jgi:DNA-binding transcriptional LysR family regulator